MAGRVPRSRSTGEWASEYRSLATRIRSEFGPTLAGGSARSPSILEFHPGVACPASCTFCPTKGAKVYPKSRRGKPLAIDEIEGMLKDFALLGGKLLILSGGLEPLQGPAIETAELAAAIGLRVHLYTSGLSRELDRPAARRRLLASVERIRFSVNANVPETYRTIQAPSRRAGEDLETIRRRIELLIEGRRPGTQLGISFVVIPQNANELVPAALHWREVGADFFEGLADIDEDRPPAAEVGRALDTLRGLAQHGQLAPLAVRVSGRTGGAPPLGLPCAVPRVKVAVDPYGVVWRCCHVANPERGGDSLRLGDVREGNLASVLCSPGAEPSYTGCRTCPDWERTVNAVALALGPDRAASRVNTGTHAALRKPAGWSHSDT